ncbi:phospholipase [Wenzhouxiangella sp. AB-CW3]|uniref:phospholipase D-like domain-containing protein n=1 Tax=Wenzhouxiangella sp. AB-CW3 TaxID=2771012 RepID=UPI00168B4D5E|nr:phospholipase D-like domain-containing protein [Wenzhouxiangella sp. AB-CW3]QOC22647.1 phospholipase [Wenzhouxiangella sp. AB-CW3]
MPEIDQATHGRIRLRWRRIALATLALAWIASGTWHSVKPLPEGLALTGGQYPAPVIEYLADDTWVDEDGERRIDRTIFDRKLELIAQAERLIVADMFLFNEFAGAADDDDMRALSSELTEALVEQQTAVPGLEIVFITDPINTVYGSMESPHLQTMREAGIEVVVTDLDRLRDSNPAWSGLWRLCCRWLGNNTDGGWLPNPVGDEPITLRSWKRLANFKANHRKTLVVDHGETWKGLVTSANPHDASSAHSNQAVVLSGPAVFELLASERAIVAFSDNGALWDRPPEAVPPQMADADLSIQVLTESAIRDAVIELLDFADSGDEVELSMFYLSHRGIIEAMKDAAGRGASVSALLDPNEHAFGRRKNGVPNRPVAAELTRAGVDVRWCHTTGEQCHDKQLLVRFGDGQTELIAGTANYTRRNLDDLNPETALHLRGTDATPPLVQARQRFDERWNNRNGRSYSLDYDEYADESRLRYWQYRIMEATGLSTF